MTSICKIAVYLLCYCITLQAHTQYYYYYDQQFDTPFVAEAGITGGFMNCFTDLGGKKGTGRRSLGDMNMVDAKPAFGVYGTVTYKYALALRLEACFGSVQAADNILRPVAATTHGRYERNLAFRSRITDVQLALELHPLFLRFYDEDLSPRLSPYAIAGAGFFHFDPEASLRGQWYKLRPLRTEGQGFAEYPGRRRYKTGQFNFPLGAGLRYELNPSLQLRLELVHRFLFTDYLDDVSRDYIDPRLFHHYLPAHLVPVARLLFDRQAELNSNHTTRVGARRGNPSRNDSFFTVMLKTGFYLGRNSGQ